MHDGLTDTHPLDIGLALIFGKPIKNRQRESEGGRERETERKGKGGREGGREREITAIYLPVCVSSSFQL